MSPSRPTWLTDTSQVSIFRWWRCTMYPCWTTNERFNVCLCDVRKKKKKTVIKEVFRLLRTTQTSRTLETSTVPHTPPRWRNHKFVHHAPIWKQVSNIRWVLWKQCWLLLITKIIQKKRSYSQHDRAKTGSRPSHEEPPRTTIETSKKQHAVQQSKVLLRKVPSFLTKLSSYHVPSMNCRKSSRVFFSRQIYKCYVRRK
jgi:hypothetical protein